MTLEQKIQKVEAETLEKIQRILAYEFMAVEIMAIGFYVGKDGVVHKWAKGRKVRQMSTMQFKCKEVNNYNIGQFTGKLGERYFLKGVEVVRQEVVSYFDSFKGKPQSAIYADLGGIEVVEPAIPLI